MRIGPLKAAIALLFAFVAPSASAQTEQNEQLGQVISNLKSCVRTHAAQAQTAGVRTSGAADYFGRMCVPSADVGKLGAIPPGLFRTTINAEWDAFIKETGAAR